MKNSVLGFILIYSYGTIKSLSTQFFSHDISLILTRNTKIAAVLQWLPLFVFSLKTNKEW
jgi:hypothetical protein